MRYWIILFMTVVVLSAAMTNCNNNSGEYMVEKSDTSRWLGVYAGKNNAVYYDMVVLERKLNARIGTKGKPYITLDSTFFIPAYTVDSTKRDSTGAYVKNVQWESAAVGSVRILENFDSSVKHITEWIKRNKK